MEIEVSQDKLAKALNSVSRITVSKGATLPILNNVLIRVDDGKVSLVTTNLDMAMRIYLPVSSSKNGVITTPAKLLAEYISALPKGENIKLSTQDTKINISANRFSSSINGALADDFPAPPELDESSAVTYRMDINEFRNSISKVIVAASNNFDRPALSGVCFNTKDNVLCVAATDGYRLAEKKLIKNTQSEVSVIVPVPALRETLAAIGETMEEIEIAFSQDLVRFRLGEIEIISKLIDASFPEYRSLFPENNNIKLEINKDEFLRIVRIAALFARRATGGAIACEAKKPNIFSVRSISNELGENDSVIETPIEVEGIARYNSRFVIDAINTIEDDTINLSFADKTGPLRFNSSQDDDYIHIVMPFSS